MATLFKISMTRAEYDAYIAIPANIIPSNYQVFISDAAVGTPNLYTGLGTNTPLSGTVTGGSGVFNNLSATGIPTVNDDSLDGYSIGSRWIFGSESYLCTNATAGSAVWVIDTANTVAEIFGLQSSLNLKEDSANRRTTFQTTPTDTAYASEKLLKDNLDLKEPKVTGKGLSTNDYTTAEKTKLTGIATGATANDTDVNLKARANHTGTQAQSTVDNLTTDLAGKQATSAKGTANGYASLDATSKVPLTQMPSLATTTTTSLAPILGANIGFPGYRRSKLIPISSTTTGSGDYQVEIAIGESALSVGATFHLAGNSQDFPTAHKDSGEFAFVKPDGNAIPFWVAEVTGTAPNRTARIYLRVAGLTGQATTVQSLVFMLYDNNLMTIPSQMSAITSVFNLLADDWDGASLDLAKWVSTGTAPTLTGSILTFDTANTAKIVDSVATFGDGMEILHRTTFVDDSQSTSRSGFIGATTANDFAFGDVWNSAKSLWVGATQSALATEPNATSRLYRLSRLAGNGSFKFTNTDTVIEATRTSVPTIATPIRPWNAYGNTRGDSDWIAVRQILAVPPTIGTISEV